MLFGRFGHFSECDLMSPNKYANKKNLQLLQVRSVGSANMSAFDRDLT